VLIVFALAAVLLNVRTSAQGGGRAPDIAGEWRLHRVSRTCISRSVITKKASAGSRSLSTSGRDSFRWIDVAPYFDRVRSDPRFAALVARLKLPDSPPGR
jgi:hypothetical protein